jgi:putative ABC transport system permease protein
MSQHDKGHLSRLGLKLLWRDWRSGELNVLVFALIVGVATVTGIGLFVDRIQRSILDEASTLLAADAQIGGSQPIPELWIEQAEQQGLQTAFSTSFRAMAFGEEGRMQLASIKAVSDDYPLKGELEVSQQIFTTGNKVTDGPAQGEAWVNSRLLATLDLSIGDSIGVGNTDFIITQVLLSEPDNTGSFATINPRIMINQQDLASTAAIQPGSRVRYELHLLGNVEPFYNQWQEQDHLHHRWQSVEDASEQVADTLSRAQSFLLLAGSLSVILSGVALALSSSHYAKHQASHVALLKTLGLTPNAITRLYAGNLTLLAIIVVICAIALGWLIHWLFLQFFAGLLPRELVAASSKPYLLGMATGMICFLGFALPPIWLLKNTPPAKALRSEVSGGQLTQLKASLLGIFAVIGLIYLYSQSLLITVALLAAGIIATIGVAILARVLISLTRKYASHLGPIWRIGLASVQRNQTQNAYQIMIFSVAFLLLFILVLVRTSLVSEWQKQLPEGTPNHFAFNIFQSERNAIEEILADNGIKIQSFYPMSRGRLIQVEGEDISDRIERMQPKGDDYQRELNITWTTTLAEDNEVIEGQWFNENDIEQNLISVEQDFAEGLGINIGSELTFSFGGQQISAIVQSIRTVQWDSMQPNFYVIFSTPVFSGAGSSYLTSFYLPEEKKTVLVDILQAYPTVSVIEVDIIIARIQAIVAQVTRAIEFILSLTLISGLIVLIASIQATLDERMRESAMLRALGAKQKMVMGALAIEFLFIGALAGFLGAVGAEAALYFLQTELFSIDFRPNWLIFVLGPFVGAAVIGAVGLISTRKVIRVPPLTILRTT